MQKNILLLAGDGIGPEVMKVAVDVLKKLETKFGYSFGLENELIGGASIDQYGISLSDAVIEKAKKADAVLMGSVGGPKWDNLKDRPEVGLLKIRKEMGVYANLRPIIVFDELADASTLKREYVAGLDIMIVRELTGDVYFGQPKGREAIGKAMFATESGLVEGVEEKGYDNMIYTTSEVRRIAKVGFDLAKMRGNKLCSVDKANVLTTSKLWRDVVEQVKAQNPSYSQVDLSHMYVDNAAMQIVRNPKQFDVIVTGNIFGDILSDCAAQLTGSIGMLPSASINYEGQNGKQLALYEPVHGSAPDIAGQNKANPIAMVLCVAMMMRYSFGDLKVAQVIDDVIKSVLKQGYRTGDIYNKSDATHKLVSTTQMGEVILSAI